jgi:hypothetical protein
MTPRPLLIAVALATFAIACGHRAEPVTGRWQRTNQPSEWIEFDGKGAFSARSYMDTVLIRGTYTQRGDSVIASSVYGHTGTLTIRDSLLVMQDGTRFRRAR